MDTTFRQFIKTPSAKRFSLIAALLCLAYFLLEWNNGRAQMADFRVYYDAANAFLHDTQLYGLAFGVSSGFYKYSPFACLPFVPLAILPYILASVLYYLIITFSIIWFSLRIVFHLQTHEEKTSKWKNIGWMLFAIALFMADHLERELHLGNVNLFLLIGAFQSFMQLQKGRKTSAGFIYGFLLLFKPHFVLLLPYYIWKKQWKTLLSSFAFIGFGLLMPALFKGFSKNNELLSQWLGAMRDHNIKLEESPNTIYGIVNHFVLNHQGGAWLILLFVSIVGIAFIAFLLRNAKVSGNQDIRFIEYFLLIALIPNLAHTDTEHFMWTWPLIAYSIVKLFHMQSKIKWILVTLMALAFIPYCLNSPDIVGRDLRYLFDEGGLLGVANLTIIGVAVVIYFSNRQSVSERTLSPY